jgi:two-component system response regulator AtoC
MIQKNILVVDDDKLIRWSVNQRLSEWNYRVSEAEDGKNLSDVIEKNAPDLVLLDNCLPDATGIELLKKIKRPWPDLPVIMITAFGSIDDAVLAMRLGAYDFITKPIDFLRLKGTLEHALETSSLKKEVAFYREKEKKDFNLSNIVAESDAMKKVLEMTKIIARSEATIVLIQGESGTGKDLIAQAIHYLSRRYESAYIVLNCSAIPENLLESELFGYEKGAFTDAKAQKKGLVELAHKSTLFLDEIGTLSLPLQAKLLRFLETQTFNRLGGLKEIEVDLRVIAATNQDLLAASEKGKFRKDLYYRLNVCPVFIPPLRERIPDILPLAEYFITQDNAKFRKNIKGLDRKAKSLMMDYPWPGNVRELKNAIERAMIFEENSYVTERFLPIRPVKKPEKQKADKIDEFERGGLSLEQMERSMLIEALRKAHGNKSEAARILKISRDTMRYKIKKYRIADSDIRDHRPS